MTKQHEKYLSTLMFLVGGFLIGCAVATPDKVSPPYISDREPITACGHAGLVDVFGPYECK